MLARVHAFNLFSNVISFLQRCISLIKIVIIAVTDATTSLSSSWVRLQLSVHWKYDCCQFEVWNLVAFWDHFSAFASKPRQKKNAWRKYFIITFPIKCRSFTWQLVSGNSNLINVWRHGRRQWGRAAAELTSQNLWVLLWSDNQVLAI